MNYPEIGAAHAPEIEKKNWMSYPEIGAAHAPEIGKKLDEFSRNRSAPRPRKLKFRKKFWMSFPGFANKGKSLAYIIDAAMVLILILEGFRLWFKRRRTF